MICFNLLFIRLSQPHDLIIVPNMLTRVDVAYFFVEFLYYKFYKSHCLTLGPTRMIEN